MDLQTARHILARYRTDKEDLRRQRMWEGEWTGLDERVLEALDLVIDKLDREIASYDNTLEAYERRHRIEASK